MKGLFDMTRHARRGMVAMLVAIAVTLFITVMVKSHREPVPHSVTWQESSLHEGIADTSSVSIVSSVRKEPSRQRSRKHQKRRPAKPGPAREPRRLDPVPNF